MADSVDTLAEMMKKLRFDILKPEEINQQPEGAASSLQDSCRKAIVRAVGLDRLCKASELPVPKPMVNFLAGELSTNDFFVNRNSLNSENISNCVYPAQCLLDNRTVMLKCIGPCMASEELSKAMKAWSDVEHPSLMKCFAQFKQDKHDVLIFEHAPCSFAHVQTKLRKSGASIPEGLVWRASAQLCDVLVFLRTRGLEYEKLKPECIAFDTDGTLKLDNLLLYMPFNEDEMMEAMALDDDNLKGIYTPPEVLNEETSDKSVTWIVGCIIYEMVTLRPAYAIQGTDMFSALNDVMEGNAPQAIAACYSEDLRGLVESCLRQDTEARPSLDEVLAITKPKGAESGAGPITQL